MVIIMTWGGGDRDVAGTNSLSSANPLFHPKLVLCKTLSPLALVAVTPSSQPGSRGNPHSCPAALNWNSPLTAAALACSLCFQLGSGSWEQEFAHCGGQDGHPQGPTPSLWPL